MKYYDRNGKRVELLSQIDNSSKRIGREVLKDGKIVSTIHLGLDHSFGDGPPLIFETMVFPDEDSFCQIETIRYATELEAIKGHLEMVKKWSGGVDKYDSN